MFTSYRPTDLQQIVLIKQEKQRQLVAIFVPMTFEGVSVPLVVSGRAERGYSLLRRFITRLLRWGGLAVLPL